jgi:RNA polymerase sigma-70 factor (ECF subfamily)
MRRFYGTDRSKHAAGQDVDQLIESVRVGREEAFGQLFEAFRRHLLLVANQELPPALRGKLGASDLVQETAVDARRDFPAFRGSTPEECFAWLRTILRNNLIDAVRRYKLTQKRAAGLEVSLATPEGRREGGLVEMPQGPPDGSAIRHEDAAILTETLLRLSADHQVVLKLRYWEGLSFIEIGMRLGRSAEAARKLWFRAVERLQDELDAASLRDASSRSSHDHLERVAT